MFYSLPQSPVLVATPGRFLHSSVEMELKLHSLQYVGLMKLIDCLRWAISEQLLEIIRRLPEMRYSAVCLYYRIVSVTALKAQIVFTR